MTENPKRVALFGGSFNPIHNGHVALAQAVLDAHLADEVWLMVSPQNPLKQQADLRPENVRLSIAQQALQKHENIKVSNFEFALPRPSYTWNTLQALSRAYPCITFSLLIGGDNWCCFDKWAHYADILRLYDLIVYPRPNNEINTSSLPPHVSMLQAPLYPYSSTDVRARVKQGKSIHGMVPDVVEKAIIKAYL